MSVESDSLLLVLPVPFRHDTEGRLLLEKQACNGLDRWADNFRRITVACPVEPEAMAARGRTTVDYVGTDQLHARDRVEFVALPLAYKLGPFLKTYRRTRTILAEKIRRCEYLSFAIGALVGDWASVAALEAIRQKRRFSVWTDNVGHQFIKSSHLECKGLKRAYRLIRDHLVMSPLMWQLERHIVGKCDLGLFHGGDCFAAYAPYCRHPHLVHDIHLKPEDRIDPGQLDEKVRRVRSGAPLRLLYAGRVVGIKGPLDWVRVMAELHSRGIAFRASWIGDGPLLAELRDEVSRLGLGAVVDVPGFVSDRTQLIETIRYSDLFVFCHKTPESPRSLVEALVSASPILGYDSSYPRDLVGDLANLLLVPRDDTAGLADRIAHLDGHRDQLAEVIERCYELGSHFSDRAVFQHRSDLIKEHLGLGEHPASGALAPG